MVQYNCKKALKVVKRSEQCLLWKYLWFSKKVVKKKIVLYNLFCHWWNPVFAILFVLQKGQSCAGELSFLTHKSSWARGDSNFYSCGMDELTYPSPFKNGSKVFLCTCDNLHWPVWVRMCPWSSQGLENALPQRLHTQGSVCVLMCILSAPRLTYSFSQYLQLKYFLLLHSHWNCLCFAKPKTLKCSLWQSKHSNLPWLLLPGRMAGKRATSGKDGGRRPSLLLCPSATHWMSRSTLGLDSVVLQVSAELLL